MKNLEFQNMMKIILSFSGINLKYLDCNKIYPTFNIQISDNRIVGNGDYDIMIKNSNTIYAISDNYIYDQIYKKQKFLEII